MDTLTQVFTVAMQKSGRFSAVLMPRADCAVRPARACASFGSKLLFSRPPVDWAAPRRPTDTDVLTALPYSSARCAAFGAAFRGLRNSSKSGTAASVSHIINQKSLM